MYSLPTLVPPDQHILSISKRCVHILGYIVRTQSLFQDTMDKYLAGLIKPGTTLTSTSGSATLGLSSKVPFGPPQVNGPSISGYHSETAIWSYDSSTKGVTGFWINNASSTLLIIWYDADKDTFYLTGGPSDPPTTKSKRVVCITLLVTALNR